MRFIYDYMNTLQAIRDETYCSIVGEVSLYFEEGALLIFALEKSNFGTVPKIVESDVNEVTKPL